MGMSRRRLRGGGSNDRRRPRWLCDRLRALGSPVRSDMPLPLADLELVPDEGQSLDSGSVAESKSGRRLFMLATEQCEKARLDVDVDV